jgi:hypothetical protein
MGMDESQRESLPSPGCAGAEDADWEEAVSPSGIKGALGAPPRAHTNQASTKVRAMASRLGRVKKKERKKDLINNGAKELRVSF